MNLATVKLTDEERGIICTALGYWADQNQPKDDETYAKVGELIDLIANAY